MRFGGRAFRKRSDFRDGWLSVDKAVKSNRMDSPVGGTKSGKPKRLPSPDLLIDWIERFIPKDARLRRQPLFVNPNTGGPWTPTSMRRCPARIDDPLARAIGNGHRSLRTA